MKKEILIGQGFGSILFGSTRGEVASQLGQPTKVDKYFYRKAANNNEVWFYQKLSLSAIFDEEDDYRLGSLEASSPKYLLNGHSLIGKRRDEVIKLFSTFQLGSLEIEEMSFSGRPDCELISFDKVSLDLWIETGRVVEIQWGPLWQDEDHIIWPKIITEKQAV